MTEQSGELDPASEVERKVYDAITQYHHRYTAGEISHPQYRERLIGLMDASSGIIDMEIYRAITNEINAITSPCVQIRTFVSERGHVAQLELNYDASTVIVRLNAVYGRGWAVKKTNEFASKPDAGIKAVSYMEKATISLTAKGYQEIQ